MSFNTKLADADISILVFLLDDCPYELSIPLNTRIISLYGDLNDLEVRFYIVSDEQGVILKRDYYKMVRDTWIKVSE